jgi:AcrR family transcriptional regulator
MMKSSAKEKIVEEFRSESIQDAAIRVIARKGIAGASMNEIAEEAGISKGTIYLYFENQRDLIEKTVDRAFASLHVALGEAFESEGTCLERLRGVLRVKFGFLAAHADLLRIYAEMKFPEGPSTASVRCDRENRPHFKEHQERLVAFLASAMEAGEIRPMNPRRLAVFLQDGLMGVLLARLSEADPPSIDDDVSWLNGVILNGIATRGTAEEKRSRA